MSLLNYQSSITPFRGLPNHETKASSSFSTVAGETALFYYSNGGVRTLDAGQAAGVAVACKLQFCPVLNSNGSMQATNVDTSLSFTSTAFTTERPFTDTLAPEGYDSVSWANRLAAVTKGFANGEYCVDYTNGVLYGVKASTQVSITAATYIVPEFNSGQVQVATANTPAIVTSAGTAIAANPSRKGWAIQNLDTDPLFVRLGGTASSTVFHFVLKGGTGADDGTGGSISQTDGAVFTGLISVAGTTPRFTTLEM